MGTKHIFPTQLSIRAARMLIHKHYASFFFNYVINKFCTAPLQLPFFAVHATASQFTGTSCLPICSFKKFKNNLSIK